MQYAKDSFYVALRERLSGLNPLRTVTVNGVTRPAVIVAENELVIPIDPLPDAFYLEWGAVEVVNSHAAKQPLMQMDCVISYHTLGSSESGVDRGRSLASLDAELLGICQPQHTPKRDYSQAPSVDLGTNIFWTVPQLGEVAGQDGPARLPERSQGARLERKTMLKLFFFSQVEWI